MKLTVATNIILRGCLLLYVPVTGFTPPLFNTYGIGCSSFYSEENYGVEGGSINKLGLSPSFIFQHQHGVDWETAEKLQTKLKITDFRPI